MLKWENLLMRPKLLSLLFAILVAVASAITGIVLAVVIPRILVP